MIQRNIRTWCLLRTWDWFKLYGRVKPMLKAGKEAEEMDKLSEKIKALEESLVKEEGNRKELESQVNHISFHKIFINLSIILKCFAMIYISISTLSLSISIMKLSVLSN